MAETKEAITFTHKELAEILVKQQNIHEGLWGIVIEFAFAAGLVPFPPSPEPNSNMVPAAIVPVGRIGIQKFDSANSVTVDASLVNPKKSDS